jgi:hypothetical protein
MAFSYPTPEKTWTITPVIPTPVGSRVGDIKQIMWEVKEALKTVGWTVAGSNDGTTAGMDAVDRIDSPSKISFTTNGAWWIVMKAPAGWGNGEYLMTSNAGGFGATNVRTAVSISGAYTGGNTTTIPTATDEDNVFDTELFDTNIPAGGAQLTGYILTSSDGQHTRIFYCSNGQPTGVMVFETAGSPASKWLDPRFYGRGPIFVRESPWQLGNEPLYRNGSRKWLKAKLPSALTFPFFYVSFPWAGGRVIWDSITDPSPNEIDGSYPIWNVGLYNWDTAGARGEWGYIKDWWMTVGAASPGDFFPGDGSMQFIMMGGALLPWDGATIPNFG